MLGALQGIVLGILLFTQQSVNKAANKVLALLLFFMSYRLLVEVSVYYGYAWVNHWSYHLLFEYDWIYGPLIYLYICFYLIKDFKWQSGLWVLFIPVGIEFLFSNWVKIQNFFWDGSTDSLPFLGSESYQLWEHTPFQLVVMSILIVYYSLRSTQLVNKLRGDRKVEITKDGLKWIHQILIAYIVFSLVTFIFVLVDYFFYDYAFNSFYQFPVYVVMAILTYWLGLSGYMKRNEVVSKINKSSEQLSHLKIIAQQLDEAMLNQKLYLKSDLNLTQLGAALEIKPYLITAALNKALFRYNA